MSTHRVDLEDGKYTVINDNGTLTFLRHGEPWPAADDLRHAGVVLALVQRLEEVERGLAHKEFLTEDWRGKCLEARERAEAAEREGLRAREIAITHGNDASAYLRRVRDLEAALARLASPQTFTTPAVLDGILGAELRVRMKFAGAALAARPADAAPAYLPDPNGYAVAMAASERWVHGGAELAARILTSAAPEPAKCACGHPREHHVPSCWLCGVWSGAGCAHFAPPSGGETP